MTHKLYYEDSYCTIFQATVVKCVLSNDQYHVVLDQTAFYPEGGGQSCDTGILENIPVESVYIKEETIYHVIKEPLIVGMPVTGKIDFKRRFDYMQQHTGEHIVSGLINKHYGYNNVGFHLSEDYMTADFDGVLKPDMLLEIENLANMAVYENLPIQVEIFDNEKNIMKEYRSKIEIEGSVRLVTIEGYDTCACCGTHTNYTGEVGIVKIIENQKYKGGSRITILCGRRALRDYEEKTTITGEISQLLSSKPGLLLEAVTKQQQDITHLKQRLTEASTALFKMKAEQHTNKTKNPICIIEENLTVEELKCFCNILIEKTEAVCLIVCEKENGLNYALGCSVENMQPVCKILNQVFDGKGGGKKVCQGTFKSTLQELKFRLEEVLGDTVTWFDCK